MSGAKGCPGSSENKCHPYANPTQLKCTREIPCCARCSRLGLSCAFPEPPDRKLLASVRINARKRKPEGNHQEGQASSKQTPFPSYNSISNTSVESCQSNQSSCTDINNDLPKPLRLFLIEVYFKHMYNSGLLFHEPTFLNDVEAGLVPTYVLLSIYATATMYHSNC